MPLLSTEFRQLCEYCSENLIHPEDALRQFVGLSVREPFLIPAEVCKGRKKIDRFLAILGVLCKRGGKKFEAVAPNLEGNVRKYFGLSPSEVFSTGHNNSPKKIPNTTWWVCSNNDGLRKGYIVYQLMTGMGFGSEYARMVSSVCCSKAPYLPWDYKRKYEAFAAKQ